MSAQMLDNRAEAFIQQAKEASTSFVTQKIKDALFLDSKRYGVDAEGRRVKIYMNNNQIIEKVFRQATGLTVSHYIESLPIEFRHMAGTLRSHLENRIAKILIEKLSELSVGRTLERVLLQGYGIAKEAIASRMDARYQNQDQDINLHLEAVLNETNLKSLVANTAQNFVEDKASFGHSEQQAAEFGLKEVLGRSEYQIKRYLNTLLQDVTAYAICKALRVSSEASLEICH